VTTTLSSPPRTEPPRTRLRGTHVHAAATVDDFIAGCRDVLAHGYAKIGGTTVDATTAGAMVAVWDALSEKNRGHARLFYDRHRIRGGERLAVAACVGLFWKFIK